MLARILFACSIICLGVTGCVTRTTNCAESPSDPNCRDFLDGSVADTRGDAPTIDTHVACGGPCSGTNHVCNAATDMCVGCLHDSDCSGSTPRCEPTSNTCVACLGDTDCATASAAHCDTTSHICARCTTDAQCMRFAATPACDTARGACAQCTTATAPMRCGANSCRASDGTCTTTPRGSLSTCAACQADSECTTGSACVRYVFMGADTGSYCFLNASGGCGDTVVALRPYRTRAMLTSVDGAVATYCMPPASTTCRGIADAQSVTCTMDSMCGTPGRSDAFCPTTMAGAGACNYACGGNFDCRSPLTCQGAPSRCAP